MKNIENHCFILTTVQITVCNMKRVTLNVEPAETGHFPSALGSVLTSFGSLFWFFLGPHLCCFGLAALTSFVFGGSSLQLPVRHQMADKNPND